MYVIQSSATYTTQEHYNIKKLKSKLRISDDKKSQKTNDNIHYVNLYFFDLNTYE